MALAKGGALKYTQEGINNVFFGKSSDPDKQSIYDTNKFLNRVNTDLAPWHAKKFFPASKGGDNSMTLENTNRDVVSKAFNMLGSVVSSIDVGNRNSAQTAYNPPSYGYETSGSMPSSAFQSASDSSYQAMADRNNMLSLAINRENNQFNANQAALQRSWATSLANSAHQREVADLKAAGLNPVLSAGGSGAVTPAGSTATNASYANVAGDSVIGALATLAASAMSANAVTTAAGINARPIELPA